MHAHPELSFREYETASFIEKALAEEGIPSCRIAETGVLVRLEGRGDLRRATVLRADIDALPVTERTGLEFSSLNDGVMHACGHDIHAAVLFGVLCRLNAVRDFDGTVFGVFQPGEECNPGGASKVLEANPFDGYDVVAVIGEHVDPGLETGELGFCPGEFMASNDELRFHVRGRGGHAAMPETRDDVVTAAAQIVTMLSAVNDDRALLAMGRVIADGATNVVPDEVYMEGTMRTFDESVRHAVWRIIGGVAASVDAKYGTRTEVDIDRGYPCVRNDAELTETAERLAGEMFRVRRLAPRRTSEDFGYYTQRYPSLFYRLGVGAAAGRSHTSAFAPDERAIEVGTDFMSRLAVTVAGMHKL